jgi:PAS domain S-box-containing protein
LNGGQPPERLVRSACEAVGEGLPGGGAAEQILDSIGDLIFVKGPGSRLLWANGAFRECYGMSNQELKGLVDAPFVDPDYTLQYVRDDEQVFTSGRALEIPEEPVTRHDGRVRLFHTLKSPIFDAGGRVAMIVGVCRDITERKQLEERLRVDDRARSLGTLAAGVAHEINSPLAAVVANLSCLREQLGELRAAPPPRALVDELDAALRDAEAATERIRSIVANLKACAAPPSEERAAIDLTRALDASATLCWNEIRHARLIREYGPLPRIVGSAWQLQQVFIALLVNAAQAMPEDAAEANELRLVTRTDAGGRAVVEVHDTGSGISPEVLRHLFDPFFTTRAVGSGSGLGLPICQAFVRDHGGEISVESAPGGGSVFRVVLPPSTRPATSGATAPPDAAAGTARRGRLLVVDDDPMILRAIHRTLKEHEVVTVTSGAEALALLSAGQRFDVVLSDLMMPEMTGMELHGRLLAVLPDCAEGMIFLTGGAFSTETHEFLARVPNQRLYKPFDPRELRALVRDRVG